MSRANKLQEKLQKHIEEQAKAALDKELAPSEQKNEAITESPINPVEENHERIVRLEKELAEAKKGNNNDELEELNKQLKEGLLKYGFIAVLIVVPFIYIKLTYEPIPKIEKTEAQIQDEKTQNMIEYQFSGWNGEHTKLAQLAKQTLKFPLTYKHIATDYVNIREEGNIIVRSYFSGENAFGVPQQQCLMAKYTYAGTQVNQPPERCD